MAENSDKLTIVDGSLDWSEGVNSDVVTTIQSEANPNGLKRTQLAWTNNCTVRGGGGVHQRPGFICTGTLPTVGPYQGSSLYDPGDADPYFLTVIGGHVWRVPADDPASATDLSVQFNLFHPITERCFFCQAEMFMIIQAGDSAGGTVIPGTTDANGHYLPLFWDGATLRRSLGITNTAATDATGPGVNEIPAATAMCYYMGRLWYAQGRTYSAGDIVNGAAGTPAYQLKDAVLNVTENPLVVGGDGFTVPSSAGNIRGIAFAANINTQLGQGTLYIGTREQIYSLNVPITRTDWVNSNNNNQPLQTVALVANGWVSDRSIVEVNGDLFFQSLEPSIRSLTAAVRNFQQWGNVPISTNEQRIMQFVDRSLLRFSSGVYFDNRLLQTSLPYVCPVGVAHKAIIPLNFDVISTLTKTLDPAWEGMWEGINFLELCGGDFGGRQRAFSFAWSDEKQTIQLWEITDFARFDRFEGGDNRVVRYFETPAFTWGNEFALKKLVGGEIWFDALFGTAILKIEYRPDGYVCWFPWHEWECCTEGNQNITVHYPSGNNRESYRQTQTLPNPPQDCASVMARPSNIGYQFQVRLTIKGYCRIRGLLLHAERFGRKLYENMQ